MGIGAIGAVKDTSKGEAYATISRISQKILAEGHVKTDRTSWDQEYIWLSDAFLIYFVDFSMVMTKTRPC